MRSASTATVILLGLVASSRAFAQPGGPDTGAPAEPAAQPAAPPTPVMVQPPPTAPPAPAGNIDLGVVEDAMSPGAMVFPTALSEPAGSISASLTFGATTDFKSTELTSLSASAALTNEISISATALIPTEDFRLGALSAKAQIIRAGRVRIALQGNLIFDNNSDYAGLVGGAGTLCLDDPCNSYASAYVGVGIEHGTGDTGVPIALSGSAVVQVVPHVKVVGEVVTGFSTSNIGGQDNGFLGFLGARFTSKFGGVNVGLARPFGLGGDDTAVFFASLTGRFMMK